MSVPLIDSLATTEALADLFSDKSVLQAMLDFEIALARVEARMGIIPATASDAIADIRCGTSRSRISRRDNHSRYRLASWFTTRTKGFVGSIPPSAWENTASPLSFSRAGRCDETHRAPGRDHQIRRNQGDQPN